MIEMSKPRLWLYDEIAQMLYTFFDSLCDWIAPMNPQFDRESSKENLLSGHGSAERTVDASSLLQQREKASLSIWPMG